MIQEEIDSLTTQKRYLKIHLTHKGEHIENLNGNDGSINIDYNTATLEIRSGAGGDEAGLFCKRSLQNVHKIW